jgi:serine/threonine protein kinase
MAAMEHLINVHAARNCRGHVADFLGYCSVPDDTSAGSGAGSSKNSRLTPGLWLAWRYEGTKTLNSYLRRRDALRALGRDLGITEDAVAAISSPTSTSSSSGGRINAPPDDANALAAALALRHVLAALSSLHGAGLVHRDVKPLNLILSERDRRLKLIDLGAAADLRGGTNFSPEESILDPLYAPPEQFALPTTAVDLSSLSLAALAVSPVLWAAHKPDRFDSWSAGVVLLQLALPSMRSAKALANFRDEYRRADYDLRAWRDACRWVPRREHALVLDRWGGSGWDLAQGLLQPRADLEMGDDGSVKFGGGGAGGGGGGARLSASEAMRHPFLRAAALLERQLSGSSGGTTQQRPASAAAAAAPSAAATDEARLTPAERRARMMEARSGSSGGSSLSSSSARSPTLARGRSASPAARRQQQQQEEDGGSGGRSSSSPSSPGSSRGLLSAAARTWRSLSDRLFDLEASVFQAATESATATATVTKLKRRAASSSAAAAKDDKAARAAAAALPAAEVRAGRAQARLESLRREAADVAARARGVWGLLGIGKGSAGSGSRGDDDASASSSAARSSSSSSSTPAAAAAAAAAPSTSISLSSFLSGAWGALGERLVALELRVAAAERDAESQTAKVRRLRQEQGKADELRRAEAALGERQRALGEARGAYERAWRQATSALAGMVVLPGGAAAGDNGGGGEGDAPSAAAATDPTPAPPNNDQQPSSSSSTGDENSRSRSPLAGFAYAGLRLGGFAAKVVADAVASAGADAYRAVAALEAEAEQRARARAADAAFLEALRGLLGEAVAADVLDAVLLLQETTSAEQQQQEQGGDPTTPTSLLLLDPAAAEAAWGRASTELSQQPAWRAVVDDGPGDAGRRRQLVDAYVAAARQVALRRAEQACSAFREVCALSGCGDDTPWKEVAPLVEADARCTPFLPPDARERLYKCYLRDTRLERAERRAAARLAAAFRALLERADAPAITASARWSASPSSLRAQLKGDPAYEALSEERRAALFEAYVAELRAQQQREEEEKEEEQRQQQAAAAAASASSSPSSSLLSLESSADEALLSAEDLAQLRLLRQEQARLRDEYERMEQKLREVEGRLAASSVSPSPGGERAAGEREQGVEEDDDDDDGQAVGARVGAKNLGDGAVLFTFD